MSISSPNDSAQFLYLSMFGVWTVSNSANKVQRKLAGPLYSAEAVAPGVLPTDVSEWAVKGAEQAVSGGVAVRISKDWGTSCLLDDVIDRRLTKD